MSLLYVFGLLGLLGIPVLIFIYIIKNKYTEQTISSTYLWSLSEKFIKRRIPINRLVGIISLILQILMVILISVLLAHPVITVPNAARAYCFVLDGSGSMNISLGEKTRFEAGKDEIRSMVRDASNGSEFTLIFAADTTDIVYERLTDKERALNILDSLDPAYVTPDIIETLDTVEGFFKDNNGTRIYLITDKNYEEVENIELINVTEGFPVAENYALTDVGYEVVDGSSLHVRGKAVSYTTAASLTVELYVNDDDKKPEDFVKYDTATVQTSSAASGLEEAHFELTCNVPAFKAVKVVITETDALAMDNEIRLYNTEAEKFSDTLIVSDTPFFVKANMEAAGNVDCTVVSTEEYEKGGYSGYGLYVFDGYDPVDNMPRDGAVWFFGPRSTVSGSNFSYQGDGTPKHMAEYSDVNSSTVVKSLLTGVSMTAFDLGKYSKCGVGGNVNTLISCDENPILFTCTNAYGNRETVFAFRLNDSSDFTMSSDCAVLFSNLLGYTFPTIVTQTEYYSGDTMLVHVPSGCSSIEVVTPSGQRNYIDTTSDIAEYKLGEVGVFDITMKMKSNEARSLRVFSSLAEEERFTEVVDFEFTVRGTYEETFFDGIYDDLMFIFIALAVIAVADFGVYCYEQYQLR